MCGEEHCTFKGCGHTGKGTIIQCANARRTGVHCIAISTVAKSKNGNCRDCKAEKKEKKEKDKEKGRKVGAQPKVYSGKMLYCSLS
jgi:hypothetical protein